MYGMWIEERDKEEGKDRRSVGVGVFAVSNPLLPLQPSLSPCKLDREGAWWQGELG